MVQYIISYIGGNQPASKEEAKELMVKYMGWLSGGSLEVSEFIQMKG